MRKTPAADSDGSAGAPVDAGKATPLRHPLMAHWPRIAEQIRGKPLAVFLDFDGTLAPIVPQHDAAQLLPQMRELLIALAQQCPMSIVSGRDLDDLRRRVDLPHIFYAGSHGLEIAGPHVAQVNADAAAAEPHIADIAARLTAQLGDFPGARIERKRFSLAVHYRTCDDAAIPQLRELITAMHAEYPRLRTRIGKKVIEVEPDVAANKGSAVRWLLDHLRLRRTSFSAYTPDLFNCH